MFKFLFSTLLCIYPEVELLDHMIILSFIFGGAIILFSMATAAFGQNVPAWLNNFSIV